MKQQINIAANIQKLRKKKGLTQEALVEKLYVTNKTVSKWERGAGYPEITQLASIAKILDTTVDDLLLGEKYGITVAGNILTDNVKLINDYPSKGMLSTIYSSSRAVGGCVPNTAIDLAVIDRNLSIDVLGKVGNDESGRFLISEMQKYGINTNGVVMSTDHSTGYSDVMSIRSSGERTFFHHRGANSAFSPVDITISSLNCKMLHIGYILLLDMFDEPDEVYGTVMARFLKKLKDADIKTSIDVVSSNDGNFAEKVIPALKYTDNAIMNEIEGCGIASLPPRDSDGKLIVENIKAAMKKIISCGVSERVIIHCPEAGFILNAHGEFTEVPSLKLEKGYIKGTVGAGDAFCAGCLYGIYKGMSDREILRFAAAAAACNLSAEDSVSGMKPKEYIYELLESHPETK